MTTATKTIPVGSTPAQPPGKARPTVHEVPVKLEIVEPRDGSTYDLPFTPEMPAIPLHARVLVQGAPVSTGRVRWEIQIAGQYRVRSAGGGSYTQQAYKLACGDTTTAPDEEKKFTLAPAELVGGTLSVQAFFEGGAELAGITATQVVKTCKVQGKNPPRADVEAFIAEVGGELSWLYLRMFCHESLHQLAQFAKKSGGGNTPGEPLYGPPSGVGIVQRDPTAPEWVWPKSRITTCNNFFPRIFWDWKKNVREGVASFTSDYIERGRRDLDGLRKRHQTLPEYPEGVLLRAAIRRYNGGTEFVASPDGKHYVVSPSSSNPGYVNEVLGDPDIDATRYPVPADALATIWPAPAPAPARRS
jgi:type VI secretion system secreted protein VgrG